ncbi:hypothetical protein SBA2_670059 [Acidobacteriia bacterium SbA2]|nr:hypothetical protein SBA2_670059 [Acidobacteriia bacterium SbA2]
MAVILSEAKDLQFRPEANQCRFLAALGMTAEPWKRDWVC